MNLRRQGAPRRASTPVLPVALALLLVFAVFINLSGATWAQDARYAFPYFGPDPVQSDMIKQAYVAQSRFFTAISDPQAGGLSALQFLAVLAALVGGILIAFNRKYWNLGTLVSWLLVSIITIFAPAASTLLFYKVNQLVKSKTFVASAIQPGPCTDNFNGCGFTPQMVGIHVASVMQLVVADVFKSQGWRDVVAELMADQRLSNTPLFANTTQWVADQKKFAAECGTQDLGNLVATVSQGGAGSNSNIAEEPIPVTIEQSWDQWRELFNRVDFRNTTPQMFVLHDESSFPNSWNKEAYSKGIELLYRRIVNPGQSAPSVTFGGGNGTITIKQALDEIEQKPGLSFFKVIDETKVSDNSANNPNAQGIRSNSPLMPGFFFVRNKDVENSSNISARSARQCYVQGQATQAFEVCQAPNSPQARGGVKKRLNNNGYFAVAERDWHQLSFMRINDAISTRQYQNLPVEWIHFITLYQNPLFRNLQGSTTNLRARVDGDQAKVEGGTSTNGCVARGVDLVRRGIEDSFGQRLQPGAFQPIENILLGSAPVPNQLSLEQVISGNAIKDPQMKDWGNTYLTFLNTRLRDLVNNRARLSQPAPQDEEKRIVLVAATLNQIIQNSEIIDNQTNGTGTRTATTGSSAEQNALDAKNNLLVGNETITAIGGGLATFFGSVLINVGAIFTGAIAKAFLAFITLIIQLSLVALIVLTPFFFLAGVLMPGSAFGVLVITVMATFILQFVPITLIILNYLGGFLYSMISVAPTDWAAQKTMQAMIVIGISGIYTAIIGFTLYLMFKLGDPAAMLGRLSALDGAAKQAADLGFKAGLAAMTPLMAGALGAVLPLFSGKYKGPIDQLLDRKKGRAGGASTGTTGNDPNGKGPDGDGKTGAMAPVNAAESDGGLVPDALSPNSDIAGNFLGEFSGDEYDKMNRALKRAQSDTNFIKHTFEDKDDDFRHMVDLDDEGRFKAQFDKFGNLTGTFRQEPPGSGELRQFPAPETLGSVGADASAEGTDTTADQEAANQPTDTPDATRGTDDIKAGNLVAGAGSTGSSPAAGTEPAKTTTTQQVAAKAKEEQEARATQAVSTAKQTAAQGMASSSVPLSSSQQTLAQETAQFTEQMRAEISKTRRDSSLSEDEKKTRIGIFQKAIEDAEKNAQTFNQVGGDLGAELLKLSKIDEVSKARLGADVKPGWGSVMASGFLGGFKAVGGGIGSIPIIGSVLKGSINEYYEAPERAKAWQAAGGFWKHFNASGDAQRLKYYQQEIAPISAGFQYQQMEQAGTFQAQVDLQLNTTAQAVARSRADFEALLQRKLAETRDDPTISVNALTIGDIEAGRAKILFDAADYKGIGMIDAASKLGTIRAESFAMQANSLRVAVPDGKGNNYTDIKPNAALFQRVYGDLGKDVAKQYDQSLLKWYGVVEKQMGRGKDEWNATRTMSSNRAAMASFMAQDISLDYLVSGHYTMVTGKDQFMRMRGMVLDMIKTRNLDAIKENEVITKFIVQQGGDKQKSMIEALKVTEKDFFDSRKASGKTEVEIFTDYKNSFFKKSPRADMATFERTILNNWAKTVGGFKAQMDLMAEEQVIRGGAEWNQRLDRAAKASYQEIINKRKARAKDLSERASELGKSTDSITWGQTTKNPLKAYGAVSELADPINTKLIKAFKKIGMSEEKALERAAEIAFGIIENNIDILDSYQVSTVKIGQKEHNAIMFAKKDLEEAFQSAVAQAAKDGVDIAELTADLNKSFKDIDDTASTGRVALRESKAE